MFNFSVIYDVNAKKLIAICFILILAGCVSKPIERPVIIPHLDNGKIGAADEFAFATFPEETRPFDVIKTPEKKKNPPKK